MQSVDFLYRASLLKHVFEVQLCYIGMFFKAE